MGATIKSYKGYNKDMTCEGFQFEEGAEYEAEKDCICEEWFIACTYPLDCLKYYNPAESIFREVEQGGNIRRVGDDSKIVSSKIKIGTSLNFAGLVKAAIEYTISRTDGERKNTREYEVSINTGNNEASFNTGNYGLAGNTGDYGASSNGGRRGASSNTGYYGVSVNTGYSGATINTGNCGVSGNVGYRGAAINTGDYGAAINSGYGGAAINTGYGGVSINTGNCGVSNNTGHCGYAEAGHPNNVAIAWGPESKAKGVTGSYLVFAEWERNGEKYDSEEVWNFKEAKMIRVDGEIIKEDIWYRIKNGEIVEVK